MEILKTSWKKMVKGTLVCLLLLTSQAFAQTAGKGISFQAFIKSPSGTAVNATGLTVNAKVLAPNGCILREESFSNINVVNGYMNIVVTKGTAVGADRGFSVQKIFDNTPVAITGLTCINADGSVNGAVTSYTPSSSDTRRLRISTFLGSDAIVADFNVRSVPFATNAETVNGKVDTDFVNINDSQNVSQANVESIFNRFTKLDAILNSFNAGGTAAGINVTGNAANVTGTVAIANGGTGATTLAGAKTALGIGTVAALDLPTPLDATKVLKGDGTWGAIGGGGGTGTVTSVDSANGDISVTNGTVAAVLTLNSGTGANQVVKLDSSAKLPAVDGSALINITTTIDKVVNAAAKYFDYKPNNVACGNGEILKYQTGTGWVCANAATTAGAVTSVTAAGTVANPITIGGTASAPTVDIPAATSSANGYLKSTDWTTFNDKQAGSSELTAIAGLALTGIVQRTGSGTYTALGTTAPINVTGGNIGISVGAGLTTSAGSLVPDFASTNTAGKVVQANDARLPSSTCAAGNKMRWNGSAWVCETDYADPSGSGVIAVANGGTGTSTGSITGTGALTLAAGGTNQNVTLTPSGTGATILNGNVGIGTMSPQGNLDVAAGIIARGINYSTGAQALELGCPNASLCSVGSVNGSTRANLPLGIWGNPTTFYASGGTGAPIMSILSSGNVGVGTTSPSRPLQVSGIISSAQGSVEAALVGNSGLGRGLAGTISNSSFSLITNNAERLTVDTNGNVGIGTTSPISGLHVNGSSSGGLIVSQRTENVASSSANGLYFLRGNGLGSLGAVGTVADGSNGVSALTFTVGTNLSERMRIDGSGNVGIGTTSPLTVLHLQKQGAGGEQQVYLDSYSGSSSGAPSPNFVGRSSRGTPEAPLAVGTNDVLSYLTGRGYNSSSSNFAGAAGFLNGAYIAMKAAEDWTGAGNGSYMTFNTSPIGTASNGYERMRIDPSGNVGIGTTSPSSTLHVIGTPLFERGSQQLQFNPNWTMGNTSARIYSLGGKALSFGTDGGELTSSQLWINPNGNVGIGTTNPTQRLQVGSSGDGSVAIANAWNTFSDIRLKRDIERIPNACAMVDKLNGYYYHWKTGEDHSRQVGVIAQEVEAVLPELVKTGRDGIKTVDYPKLTAVLIEASKEQNRSIASLKAENADLKARLEKIEKMLQAK